MPLPDMSTNLRNYQRRTAKHEVATDTHAHDLLATFGERAQNAGVTFSGRHQRTDRIDVLPDKRELAPGEQRAPL